MGKIDKEFDSSFLEPLASGSPDRITSVTNEEIEASGTSTSEIRSQIMLAGAFEDRYFEQVLYEPIVPFATGCGQCLYR